VPTLTPNSAAIWGHERPDARRVAILAASTLNRGRPIRFPLDLAAAILDLTRFPNQLPLKLRDAGKNAEHEAAIWSARVHTLVQRDKLDPQRAELLKRIDQLTQTASKAVIAIDHNCIDEPLSARYQKGIQLRPMFL